MFDININYKFYILFLGGSAENSKKKFVEMESWQININSGPVFLKCSEAVFCK